MENIDLSESKNVIKYFCTLHFHLMNLISGRNILIEE